MGQVSMPNTSNDWKQLICSQKDFLKKKNLIARCTMKPFSPEEENVYNNNVAVSVSIVTSVVYCLTLSIHSHFHSCFFFLSFFLSIYK